jgi:hypothetical protein
MGSGVGEATVWYRYEATFQATGETIWVGLYGVPLLSCSFLREPTPMSMRITELVGSYGRLSDLEVITFAAELESG